MSDKFFMCSPDNFTVSYVINPWMDGNIDNSDLSNAKEQWKNLHEKLSMHASTYVMKQSKNMPDQVFTANAGLIKGKKVILSRFRHKERQGEEAKFQKFFSDLGYAVLVPPTGLEFEGAGDALWDRAIPRLLWMGYGHRTSIHAVSMIQDFFQCAVQELKLIDDRFYHLDTCFCPLTNGEIMYYPGAFDELSLARIRAVAPEHRRVEVTELEAKEFSCNAVLAGVNIFMNSCSDRLREELKRHGYTVHETPLTEFMKAGGAAKCLTLKLNEE